MPALARSQRRNNAPPELGRCHWPQSRPPQACPHSQSPQCPVAKTRASEHGRASRSSHACVVLDWKADVETVLLDQVVAWESARGRSSYGQLQDQVELDDEGPSPHLPGRWCPPPSLSRLEHPQAWDLSLVLRLYLQMLAPAPLMKLPPPIVALPWIVVVVDAPQSPYLSSWHQLASVAESCLIISSYSPLLMREAKSWKVQGKVNCVVPWVMGCSRWLAWTFLRRPDAMIPATLWSTAPS